MLRYFIMLKLDLIELEDLKGLKLVIMRWVYVWGFLIFLVSSLVNRF